MPARATHPLTRWRPDRVLASPNGFVFHTPIESKGQMGSFRQITLTAAAPPPLESPSGIDIRHRQAHIVIEDGQLDVLQACFSETGPVIPVYGALLTKEEVHRTSPL